MAAPTTTSSAVDDKFGKASVARTHDAGSGECSEVVLDDFHVHAGGQCLLLGHSGAAESGLVKTT
ncbi:hypothetical protein ACWGDS_13620 [Streptomyces sp. NPDC055059]|uniref:hypothetical protein n=1 Tax=unclassified Streptomyces TaxID=2593676 RepID=UPI0033B21A6E